MGGGSRSVAVFGSGFPEVAFQQKPSVRVLAKDLQVALPGGKGRLQFLPFVRRGSADADAVAKWNPAAVLGGMGEADCPPYSSGAC